MDNSIKKSPLYTLGEEIFNAVSHGVGIVFAVAAGAVMIVFAALFGDGWALASAIIYTITMFLLYLMSTLYHSFTNPKAKGVMRILDHCSIFLLIAGSYTPFCLITLRQHMGIPLFVIIWAVAILGVVLNSVNMEKFKKISLIGYVVMGWAVVFTLKPLIQGLPFGGLLLLALGGLMYTGGVAFYVMKKHRYMHSIWHLFVLAGTVLQYLSVMLYVIPSTF